MLVFPYSWVLIPVALVLGVAFVSAGRLSDSRLRGAFRVGILMAVCTSPAFTRGPGPFQLILGLLVGYLALRMVAVARNPTMVDANARSVVLQLLTPAGIVQPSSRPVERPLRAMLVGCLGVIACVVMLILGNQWRLWQMSRFGHFLDDQWVVLEIAVGAAGIHGLIVGVAGLFGHSVSGLLEQPFQSTSLSEFWARRWNKMVQVNLATGFYRPLVRMGFPTLGLAAAFAASGVMHVVGIIGAGPFRDIALPCACILWCFFGHGVGVMIERQLGWHVRPTGRWARAIAQARTVLLFLALSPGLIEPFAEVANVHGRSLSVAESQGRAPVTASRDPGIDNCRTDFSVKAAPRKAAVIAGRGNRGRAGSR